MNLADFKAQYPAYKDIPDPDLADALHAKYYSAIPRDEFMAQVGVAKPSGIVDTAMDIGKSAVGGAMEEGAGLSKAAGLAVSAPFAIYDKLHSIISGKPETGASDYAFKSFVDPSTKAQEYWAPKPGESQTVAQQLARGLGKMAIDLPVIVGTGGEAAAPQVGAPMLEAGAALIEHGMKTMSPIAFSSGINRAADLIEKGIDVPTAIKSGLTEGMTTSLIGAMPLSAPGGIIKRAMTGVAPGAVIGEIQREAGNMALADHPELQTPLTGEGVTLNAFNSALLAAVLGPRAAGRMPTRAQLGYGEAPATEGAPAAGPSVADQLQLVRPIAKPEPPIEEVAKPILDAKTPEEAITAAAKLTETPEAAPVQSVAQTVAALAPQAEAVQPAGIPTMITTAMRRQLGDLGWAKRDMAGMTPAQAWERINNQEAKNALQVQGTDAGRVQRGAGQENAVPGPEVGARNAQPEEVAGARPQGPDQFAQQVAATKIPATPEAAAAATTDHLEAARNLTRSPETKAVIEQELQARQEAPGTVEPPPTAERPAAPEIASPAPEPQAAAPVPEVPTLLGKPITEASDRALKAAPAGKPVETFTGTYKEGMNEVPARQKMLELAKSRPELDWRVEPSDNLKYPFKVSGYLRQSEQPSNDKGLSNALRENAKSVADIANSAAFREHGFGGLDVPSQGMVLRGMLAGSKNNEILKSVIPSVPIDVMDVLRTQKLTPEMLFHDKAMLQDLLARNRIGGKNVPRGSVIALVRAFAENATKVVRVDTELESRLSDGLSAVGATDKTKGTLEGVSAIESAKDALTAKVARTPSDVGTAEGTLEGKHEESIAKNLPKKLTKAALEKLSTRVKDMAPEEKQAVLKWADEQVKMHETEGERIAKWCL